MSPQLGAAGAAGATAALLEAKADPGRLAPGQVAALQRTIGNQAVARMILHAPQRRVQRDGPGMLPLPPAKWM